MNRRAFIKNLLVAAGSTLFAGTAYAYRSMELEITHERVRIEDLTESLRIVALSDLHTPTHYLPDDRLVDTVNSLKPDVLILGGDIVDRRGNEELVSVFQNVHARDAKLAIYGNWEYYGGLERSTLAKSYEKAGVNLLVNDVYRIQGITFVGLDDYLRGAPNYRLISQAGSEKGPLLVLAHCPASFDRIEANGGSHLLTISGHTHGGQIAPFGKALITPPGSGSYVHGWYHRQNRSMYVMRGIGTSAIPLRMGANPEILVLDFEPFET